MSRTAKELVIVVSRLAAHELEFFNYWGVKPPATKPPHIVHIGPDGSPCGAAEAEVWLVRGDAEYCQLPELIVAASESAAATYLLIHTGANRSLEEALQTFDNCYEVSPEVSDRWAALIAGAFQLSNNHSLYRNFVRELADYAKKRNAAKFGAALSLLREAVKQALDLHSADIEKGEERARAAANYLSINERRVAAGLAGPLPPRPDINPVAALIHDRLGRLSALLIDCQTAVDDPGYWAAEKNRYRGKVTDDLKSLRRFLNPPPAAGDDQREGESLTRIVGRILDLGVNEKDRERLSEAEQRLKSLVAQDEDYGEALVLFANIDVGGKATVTSRDVETLGSWLQEVRRELTTLDDLYRKYCVPRAGDA